MDSARWEELVRMETDRAIRVYEFCGYGIVGKEAKRSGAEALGSN